MWSVSAKEELRVHKGNNEPLFLSTQWGSFYSRRQKHFEFIQENIHRKKETGCCSWDKNEYPPRPFTPSVLGSARWTDATLGSCCRDPNTRPVGIKRQVSREQRSESSAPSSCPTCLLSHPRPSLSLSNSHFCIITSVCYTQSFSLLKALLHLTSESVSSPFLQPGPMNPGVGRHHPWLPFNRQWAWGCRQCGGDHQRWSWLVPCPRWE